MLTGSSDAAQYHVVEIASVSSSGILSNGESASPAISADGRYVAFVSTADNLVANDTNEAADVFVRDRLENKTVRVSVSSSGEEGNNVSSSGYANSGHDISKDGRYVVFTSAATNLVDDAPLGGIYLHDRDVDADGIFDETGSIMTELLVSMVVTDGLT